MKPTDYEIKLFKKIAPLIGIDHKVIKYGDENDNAIRILHCPDPTDNQIMFYCTLGLSELVPENNHTELFFTSNIKFKEAPNLLSTCAFFLINDMWKSERGGVFETLIEMYYPTLEMKHIYFTSPYLWEDKLEAFSLEGKKIKFLLAIPISDKELEYRNLNGYLALEELFEEKGIDIFDLNRKSIL